MYGLSYDQVATLFPMCTAFYGIFYIIGGKLQEKFPGRICALVGSCIMCFGILSLSFFGEGTSILTLILLFSLPYGGGCGIIFPSMSTPLFRWFVDKGGSAYGIVSAVYSIFSMVMTYVSDFLLVSFGFKSTVRFIALVYFLISRCCCFFLIDPSADYMMETLEKSRRKRKDTDSEIHVKKSADFTTRQMLHTKQYYLLLFTRVLSAPRYTLVYPSLVTLGESRGLSQTLAVSLAAVSLGAAAVGQLLIPSASDRIGRKKCSIFMLSIVLISSVFLSFARGGFFLVSGVTMVFAYSGWAVMVLPFSNDLFGLKYSGTNNGFVSLSNTISSFVAPVILSVLSRFLGDMARHVIAVAGCALALVCIFLIDTDTGKLIPESSSSLS